MMQHIELLPKNNDRDNYEAKRATNYGYFNALYYRKKFDRLNSSFYKKCFDNDKLLKDIREICITKIKLIYSKYLKYQKIEDKENNQLYMFYDDSIFYNKALNNGILNVLQKKTYSNSV
ncbi:hypothetical protein COBT_003576 [Conglomerata obtusa]